MCGRYTLYSRGEDIAAEFGLLSTPEVSIRYNITPGGPILAVRTGPDGPQADYLKWGLVPAWVKADAQGQPERRYSLINARAETAATKPAYRAAWRQRRCLVPADGFYEWQNRDGKKQPYYVRHRTSRLLAIAGLWERWLAPTGEVLESCALVTTEAEGAFAAIHSRMPLIVAPDHYEAWLASAPPSEQLISPYNAQQLSWQPVSSAVNSPRNDDARLIEPLDETD